MNIVILGAGESGVGAALLAAKKGYQVFVSDLGKIQEQYKQELIENNIPFEEGKHTKETIFDTNEIIKSPGIPEKVALIQEAQQKGISIISEIEFAARYTEATIIGITGSNGKTTTTNLTYHLLRAAGLNVGIGGNVGFSFARLVANQDREIFVLELSSFQLDGIIDFRPDIAILLNITPDHLDRYDYQLEKYIQSKFRIIRNQKAADLFIYNRQDANIKGYLNDHPSIAQNWGISTPKFDGEFLTINDMLRFDMTECSLKGPHNYFNANCAILVARKLGVGREDIQDALNHFNNAPHRMEVVAEIKGIEYINDSKATNVDAVFYALKSMEKPIIWVAGGQDKGNEYDSILELVNEKVKAIVCLGADNEKIKTVFGPIIKTIVETQSCPAAIQAANALAESGDVVLLSPACASFDLFDNYAARGDLFKKAVLDLYKAK